MDKRSQQVSSFPLNNGSNQTEYIKTLEKELMDLLKQKQKVDKKIVDIEYQIYQLETTYFEETMNTGNIIKGFDGYQGIRTDRKRPKTFLPEDRIFSLSSSTYQQSLETKKIELEYASSEASSVIPPSSFTPSQPPLKKRKYSSASTSSSASSTSMTLKKRRQSQKRNTRVAALAEETGLN